MVLGGFRSFHVLVTTIKTAKNDFARKKAYFFTNLT